MIYINIIISFFHNLFFLLGLGDFLVFTAYQMVDTSKSLGHTFFCSALTIVNVSDGQVRYVEKSQKVKCLLASASIGRNKVWHIKRKW